MRVSDVLLESPTVGLLGLRIFELSAVGLPEFNTQLPGEMSVLVRREKEGLNKMPELRPEDMREPIPIPLKPMVPAIPTNDEELRELGEDLQLMGCEGLLAQPLDVQDAYVLIEFKFEKGNQWLDTKRRDPESWNPNTWARVYGFSRGVGAGLACRKDGLCAKKFRGDVDPKEGLHPANCRNPRERRVLEFLMPILYPEKPKRISLTMANTLFGALSGVRPVNWGLLIHEIVGRAIPNIGRKPSYLSPFILHLYKHYDCITPEEEDRLTIAMEEVAYKIRIPARLATRSSRMCLPHHPGVRHFRGPHPLFRGPGGLSLPPSFSSRAAPAASADGSQNPLGFYLAKCGSIRMGDSGRSLQARPRQVDGTPSTVSLSRAHHAGSQPGDAGPKILSGRSENITRSNP